MIEKSNAAKIWLQRDQGYKRADQAKLSACNVDAPPGISFTLRRQDSSALRGLIEQADLLAYWRHTYDNVSSRTMFVSRMTARVGGDRNSDKLA